MDFLLSVQLHFTINQFFSILSQFLFTGKTAGQARTHIAQADKADLHSRSSH